MTKLEFLKDAIFHAQQDPSALAEVLMPLVSDTATSITITGPNEVQIPATGESAATAVYVGTVLSQHGYEMSGAITFALNESVTGVSVSGSTVSVAAGTEADSFVLKATSGSVTVTKAVSLVSAD